MQATTALAPAPRALALAGRALAALPVPFLLFDGAIKLFDITPVLASFTELGYPTHLARAIGIVELACLALYVVPRTAVLGALLLTAFLGGATAAKVRLEDPWFLFSIAIGVWLWVPLYVRDARLRELVPMRARSDERVVRR